MENSKGPVHVVSRAKLYELVWQSPLTLLAPRFGVTPQVLSEICDANLIPRPKMGYWSKKVAGTLRTFKAPPLLPHEPERVEIFMPLTRSDLHARAWQEIRDQAGAFTPDPPKQPNSIVKRGRKPKARSEDGPRLEREPLPEQRTGKPIAPVLPLAYGVKELSRALSLSTSKIYELVKAGELHPIKVGDRTLFVASDVMEWLDRKLDEARGRG